MQPQLAPTAAFPSSETAKKPPRSTLVSRNVTISGHRTSVRLEPEMWSGLSEICRRERSNLHEVCTSVAMRKAENTSLTAAIRVFVMAYYRAASTEDGHGKAGHGYGVALNPANAYVPSTPVQQPNALPRPMASSSPFIMGTNRLGTGTKNGMR